jgi:hypothetical protein
LGNGNKTQGIETMVKTVTESLLGLANAINGKSYPDIGYMYYAGEIGFTGQRRAIWTIVNEMGGVTYSDLNRATPHQTCNALRGYIMCKHSENGSI